MRRMRVGLNLLYLRPGEVGGTETYARRLIDALARRPELDIHAFVSRSAAQWPLPIGVTRVVLPFSSERRALRYLVEQTLLVWESARRGIEVLHSLGYTSPLFLRGARVVTIHDANWSALADYMPRLRRTMLSFFVRSGAKAAERVCVPSTFTSVELSREVRGVARKTSIVRYAPSVDTACDTQVDEAAPPYFIAFDSRSPHKNIAALCAAFGEAKRRTGFPHRLVLVGHRGSGVQLSGGGAIDHVGYLPEQAVTALLASSQGLLFPSLYEGFGLPVLDAMACGVPVACSNAGALPETSGAAALLFNPYDAASMTDAISRLALDEELRATLRARGKEWASRHSWDAVARSMLQVYEDALAEYRFGRASSKG